ncbi:methyltransferase domain-containing protein [Paenibacillus cremeus]|uniref:Methyltransferase domain-containing protein n=1 Tax=Paenibacillus cremeus TaxID=2163881 RepID=A0A559KDA1_9BACL|nr:methyltransferase domain-containing protein [Paenibacillus cremeus]TVY10121.1 methyltransferase domain-containing protein [Paenibacillus cremeus]
MSEAKFWNEHYEGIRTEQVRYDFWLEPFQEVLSSSNGIPILDLGCGAGNDTLYLTERGYQVISCDLSEEALKHASQLVPTAQTQQLNLLEPLPFSDDSAQVIISDLSLHYFAWADTEKVAAEIHRVLRPGGVLLCRVNSTHDVEYGAGQGAQLEPHYFEWEGKRKRFFDRGQLEKLFCQGWKITRMDEQSMNRYGKPKQVWVLAAQKTSRGAGDMDTYALIQKYADGYNLLVAALDGVSEEQLLFKPGEKKWSIKEVVIHLCDAELVALDRMKRVISENQPFYFKFDPDAWANRLDYHSLDMQTFLYLFRALRVSMASILENMPDDAWQRSGVHNVTGKQTLQDLVQMFLGHVDRHIQQIERNKRDFAAFNQE